MAKSSSIQTKFILSASGNASKVFSETGHGAAGLSGAVALIQGPALAAAAAIGAVGAAAVALPAIVNQIADIERQRIQLVSGFGSVDQAFRSAAEVGGVTVGAMAKLATALHSVGIEAMPNVGILRELTARATTFGKSGDDALTAFANAVKTGTSRQLAQVGTMVRAESAMADYAKSVGKTTVEMTAAERASALYAVVVADLGKTTTKSTDAFARADEASADFSNSVDRAKLAISQAFGSEAAKLLNQFTLSVRVAAGGMEGLSDIADRITGKAADRRRKEEQKFRKDIEEGNAAIAAETDRIFNAETARLVAAARAARAAAAAAAPGAQAATGAHRGRDAADAARADADAAARADAAADRVVAAAERAAAARRADARASRGRAAADTAYAAAAQQRDIWDTEMRIASARADSLTGEDRLKARIALAEEQRLRDLDDLKNDISMNDEQRRVHAIEIEDRARRAAAAAEAEAVESAKSAQDRYLAIGGAAVRAGQSIVSAFVGGEAAGRINAGFMAAYETAQAFAAYPDVAGILSHATSAALFAAEAIGGTSSVGAGAGAGAVAPTAAPLRTAPAAEAGNITINFGAFSVATPQQVGKAAAKALHSLDGGGQAAMGAI